MTAGVRCKRLDDGAALASLQIRGAAQDMFAVSLWHFVCVGYQIKTRCAACVWLLMLDPLAVRVCDLDSVQCLCVYCPQLTAFKVILFQHTMHNTYTCIQADVKCQVSLEKSPVCIVLFDQRDVTTFQRMVYLESDTRGCEASQLSCVCVWGCCVQNWRLFREQCLC